MGVTLPGYPKNTYLHAYQSLSSIWRSKEEKAVHSLVNIIFFNVYSKAHVLCYSDTLSLHIIGLKYHEESKTRTQQMQCVAVQLDIHGKPNNTTEIWSKRESPVEPRWAKYIIQRCLCNMQRFLKAVKKINFSFKIWFFLLIILFKK